MRKYRCPQCEISSFYVKNAQEKRGDGNLAMVIPRHTAQGCHTFSLASGCNNHRLFLREIL